MLMGGVSECETAQAELGNLRGIISGKLQEAELSFFKLQVAKEEQVSRWRNESLQWGAIFVASLSFLLSAVSLIAG